MSDRFGFNGQEKVNEIAGIGNHTTALFWEYDTRIARRWNIDPVDQISISNYSVMRLNPILFNDPLGDCVTCKEQGVGYKYEKKDKAELEDVVVRAKRPDHLKPSSEKSASGGWMLGGSGSMTIWQASEKRVGYNAYNRQRADWSRNIAAGWLGAGFGVPAAVVGGVKLGAGAAVYQGAMWLSRNYGKAFVLEVGKEAFANRFNFGKMDWNDVLVSTATSKGNSVVKLGGTIWNVFTDINYDKGVQSAFLGTKSAKNIIIDASAESFKLGLQYKMNKANWGTLETEIFAPMVVDQFKAGTNDAIDKFSKY